MSANSERLDQLEEGNAIGGHASEVEAIPRPAASPSAPRMTSRRFPSPWHADPMPGGYVILEKWAPRRRMMYANGQATDRNLNICVHDHSVTDMAERSVQQAKQAREELRQVVGYSIADEIEKLGRLKNRERSRIKNLQDSVPSWFSDPRRSGAQRGPDHG